MTLILALLLPISAALAVSSPHVPSNTPPDGGQHGAASATPEDRGAVESPENYTPVPMVTFQMSASTDTLELGDRLVLSLRATVPEGHGLRLDLQNSATESYAIKVLSAPDPKAALPDSAAGIRDLDFKVEVFPLSTGEVPVRLAFTLEGPLGASLVESPIFPVRVEEPPIDEKGEIRDIKGPRAARPIWPWWVLAAAALAALAAYAWHKRRRTPATAPAVPVDTRPPHVIAEADLATLEASALWGDKHYKDFYIRLTDIIRVYLDGRFGIPAPHLTTPELSRHLRQAELDRGIAAPVKDMFDRADLVKFAKIRPEQGAGPKDIEEARRVVRESTPKDLAQPAGKPS